MSRPWGKEPGGVGCHWLLSPMALGFPSTAWRSRLSHHSPWQSCSCHLVGSCLQGRSRSPRVPEQLLSLPAATVAGCGPGATLCLSCPPCAACSLQKDERSPLKTTSSPGQGPSASRGAAPEHLRGPCAPSPAPGPKHAPRGRPGTCPGLALPGGGQRCPKEPPSRMSPSPCVVPLQHMAAELLP